MVSKKKTAKKKTAKKKPAAPSKAKGPAKPKEPTKFELQARIAELENVVAGNPPPVLGEGESSIKTTSLEQEPKTLTIKKPLTIKPKMAYLKSVKNGRLYIKDKKNQGHKDLRPADKTGNFLAAQDAAQDETTMTVASKLAMLTDRKELIKFIGGYGVHVEVGLKLEEIKAQFMSFVQGSEVDGVTLDTIVR